MRLRRIERGALTLASPEVKFEIDTETHDPLDVGESILLLEINLTVITSQDRSLGRTSAVFNIDRFFLPLLI